MPPPIGAPGQVVVTMHEDASLRGTVVEVTNGGRPSVVTVVPWRNGEPAPVPPVQLAPAPLPAPPAPVSRHTAWVHVAADQPVLLETVAPGETNWKPVCTAPCDMDVNAEGIYRISGNDIEMSKSFQLATDAGGRVTLVVRPTTKGAHDLAEGLLIGGGAALVASGVVFYIDLYAALLTCTENSGCGASATVAWTGLGLAAAGAAAVIAGAVTLQNTTVTQSFAPPGSQASTAKVFDDRFRRLPSWRDDRSMTGIVPTATSIPIFSTTF
jgi:hypothetical protein